MNFNDWHLIILYALLGMPVLEICFCATGIVDISAVYVYGAQTALCKI